MLYKCKECGEIFSDYEADCYKPIPGFKEDYDYENYLVCPSCGCLDAEAYYEYGEDE